MSLMCLYVCNFLLRNTESNGNYVRPLMNSLFTFADIGSSESHSGVSYGTVAGVVAAAGGVVGGGGGTSNPSSEPRNLTLTNTFPCPVVIYNLTLPEEAKRHFEVLILMECFEKSEFNEYAPMKTRVTG